MGTIAHTNYCVCCPYSVRDKTQIDKKIKNRHFSENSKTGQFLNF